MGVPLFSFGIGWYDPQTHRLADQRLSATYTDAQRSDPVRHQLLVDLGMRQAIGLRTRVEPRMDLDRPGEVRRDYGDAAGGDVRPRQRDQAFESQLNCPAGGTAPGDLASQQAVAKVQDPPMA